MYYKILMKTRAFWQIINYNQWKIDQASEVVHRPLSFGQSGLIDCLHDHTISVQM